MNMKKVLAGSRMMEFIWWCQYWLDKDPKRIKARYKNDPEFQLFFKICARQFNNK